MKIAVFGAGYVGLVTGACFSEMGNNVIITDIDSDKIGKLNTGIVPLFEPGLPDMIRKNHSEDRLIFTTSAEMAIEESDIIFITVDTPSREDGSTDLTSINNVAEEIGRCISSYKIIVVKSTVPPGTNEHIRKIIANFSKGSVKFDMVSNPEFLQEGSAIQNFMTPDRIIIGTDSDKAREVMNDLYEGISRTENPIMNTSISNSEIVKYASNAMLAMRISFMNQIAPLCEVFGADIKEVAKGMGYDDRIGSRFLHAGIGFGGSCLKKDVLSISNQLTKNNLDNSIMRDILEVNERQKTYLIQKVKNALGNVSGKRIALWGLSYKPNTNDLRSAPSVFIASALLELGAEISAYDPEAMENMRKTFPEIEYCQDPYSCAKGSDAIILITEWSIFRNLDFRKVLKGMKTPVIVDGRNIYDKLDMTNIGFRYYGIGR